MYTPMRLLCGIVAACSALHCGALLAQAPSTSSGQAYPTKPIRVINPASPGGNSDIFFRLLQPKMSEAIGQPFVMDYRPGAGATITVTGDVARTITIEAETGYVH